MVAATVLTALLLLSACTGPVGGTGVVEGGPVAYVTPSFDGGDGALLEGVVTVTDTCVVIVDDVGQTWLPVFQRPRTTWDGTTLTYNGRSHADGGRIRLGGGGGSSTAGADYAPVGCESDFVFHVGP